MNDNGCETSEKSGVTSTMEIIPTVRRPSVFCVLLFFLKKKDILEQLRDKLCSHYGARLKPFDLSKQ